MMPTTIDYPGSRRDLDRLQVELRLALAGEIREARREGERARKVNQ